MGRVLELGRCIGRKNERQRRQEEKREKLAVHKSGEYADPREMSTSYFRCFEKNVRLIAAV